MQVLFLDMEDNFRTRVVELQGFPSDHEQEGGSTASPDAHGGQRALATGVTAKGHMLAAVSAQGLDLVHIFDLGAGASVDIEDIEFRAEFNAEGVEGSLPKMVFKPRIDEDAIVAVNTPAVASAALLNQLSLQVQQLRAGLFGADLSESFWVSASVESST